MPARDDAVERLDRATRDLLRTLRAAGPTGAATVAASLATMAPNRRAESNRAADDGLGTGARTSLSKELALALFASQCESRQLDFVARRLRAEGRGYYTIGSAGHEGNAALAAALRPTDPALLHYRSGAFFAQRCKQRAGHDAMRAVMQGMVACREDPIAGGRHKVFGSKELAILPQTSTIASHLPKAVGLSLAIAKQRRLGLEGAFPADAIVICSFGDASVNHSTAVGAINAASHASYQGLKLPLLLVCEDNGLGISTRTPRGFIEASFRARPGLRYFSGDSGDLFDAMDASLAAAQYVRSARRPAFLHFETVRLLGHAGSDVELSYRTMAEIRTDEQRDPLLRSIALIIAAGLADADELLGIYDDAGRRARSLAGESLKWPGLRDAEDVMKTISRHRPAEVSRAVRRGMDSNLEGGESAARRRAFWEEAAPEGRGVLSMAGQINAALGDLLVANPNLLVFGEDVADKGGVYGVTRGLKKRAGAARVFDTILDEQAILGLAIGAAQAGMLPVSEIQYLAYLHNAEDQLRGEAATLSFFSGGQYVNPMVVRIAAFAYQKGFGGHFHNDNAVAVLRDIPGIVVATPSRGDDAAAMLRTLVAAAEVDGTVGVFLEPIALYSEMDLYEAGDGAWCWPYQPADEMAPVATGRTYLDGRDILLVSFANGVPMSLRIARQLAREGIYSRVLDLRWLSPLPLDDLIREAKRAARVLVVDETRRSGGIAEGVMASLLDAGYRGPLARVCSLDSFVPLGPAADHVLLSEPRILEAARRLCREG